MPLKSVVHSLVRMPILFACLLFSCENPFFPPTGTPDQSPEFRATPSGLLGQLRRSYASRRITLFKDLFDEEAADFRFYVPQSSIQELPDLNTRATVEVLEEDIPFVGAGGTYEYISYADEVEIHRNMFEQAQKIEFVQLDVDSVFRSDSLVRIDSFPSTQLDSITNQVDTSFIIDSVFVINQVAVRTRAGAKVEISADIVERTFGASYQFELGRQVFILKRDPDDADLWVIDKWFELPY